MKKYTLLAALMIGCFFSGQLSAQNSSLSPEERQTMHKEAQSTQQNAAVNAEMERMIFRFESAYEEKDVESTKILQNTLAELMENAMDYQVKNGQKVDSKTDKTVANFADYTFDFSRVELKQDMEMKGVPSMFMKMMK